MIIIGYIHVCQRKGWEKSFDMLFNCIKNSSLYESTSKIRLGVLSDNNEFIDNDRFNDPKFEIIYKGNSSEYERPTLLHMRNKSETDDISTRYYYLHTKGISHFGNDNEQNIIDWINLMLYWNIEKWDKAILVLNRFNTYGCNYIDHYSGNFWWAKNSHIRTLPKIIPSHYIAPEEWVTINKNKIFCVFKSGYEGMGHYTNPYPRSKYDSIQCPLITRYINKKAQYANKKKQYTNKKELNLKIW